LVKRRWGNDIYATIEVEDDATEEVIEKEAKQAIFNYVDWGWVEQEQANEN